jgi:UDP-N-acetylglucosamine/UDP-N-acetylgalactosamine diphosphorylase
MTDEKLEHLRDRYEKAGQGHVFQCWDELSESEKEEFAQQLESVEVERLASLLEAARDDASASSDDVRPFSGKVGRSSDKGLIESSRRAGMEAIGRGEVAALVLAGGQGTRLGFSGPKGMYDIGLPSGRTLFQMMSERIKRLSMSSKNAVIPFYIMTSPLNHDETVQFFRSKDFFGLGEKNVVFFQQGVLPCLTDEGKMMLEGPGKLAMAPDGNGGIYPALQKSGALGDMVKQGVKFLHVFSIDNALVKPADPVFVGYCLQQNADCGNKVVWKAGPHEKVGVVAERAGKPCIVEYSEITTDMAEQTDEQDRLVYGAANICNHYYTLEFLKNKILPNIGNLYHLAHKKIPYYDAEKKETVMPAANNGIKLETFIFDVFPLSERIDVLYLVFLV